MTLTDTESLAVLDVHYCIEREHDTKIGPRIVCLNADDFWAVVADNGFGDWKRGYEIAVWTLSISYIPRFNSEGNRG
ncbi:hypothetical protein SAMN05216564_10954 [Halopenitus persicus]|uniref:Uncharacterized protein n=1 Tax=Halopenitus persicus TaxID=1048396 RepID=A0A1H3MEW3_9EURY|nr:hypothetical protein SAMN05216564_10954 [Halopenitus persicus]